MNKLRTLPNQDKFRFIGIDKEGNRHKCLIRKTLIGYRVYREIDDLLFFLHLIGWESL